VIARDTSGRRVLVTQAATRNGYVITYSLGTRGVRVSCADTVRVAPARFSRHCASYHRYPSPHRDPDGYFRALGDIIAKEKIDLLLPAYDEAYFLAQYREKLPRPDLVVLPDHPTVLALHNKAAFYKLCDELGCRTPATAEINGPEDVERAIGSMGLPMVLKPERGGGGWGITFARTREEVLGAVRDFDSDLHQNRLMAQQFIGGDLYGLGVLCIDGTVVATNGYRTVRQHPIGRGTPCFRSGVSNEKAKDYARRIFGRLKWTGVCQIDYLQGKDADEIYYLDANPRIWGSTAQALASGTNFPYMLFLLATGRRGEVEGVAAEGSPGVGVKTSWLWGDMIVLWHRLVGEKGRLKILREHLGNWRESRFDDLRIEDPLPFLFYPVQKVAGLFGKEEAGF
jgi:predicted ATP-grasp superfamily ATP-dependent carboligase